MITEKAQRKQRIMVVEDSVEQRMLMKQLLEADGYDVIEAGDGNVARSLIDQMTPPDIIISDLVMPFVNEFELVSYMRSKLGWKGIPLFLLSGRGVCSDHQNALLAGATTFINKPYHPLMLLNRLREVLVEQGYSAQ